MVEKLFQITKILEEFQNVLGCFCFLFKVILIKFADVIF